MRSVKILAALAAGLLMASAATADTPHPTPVIFDTDMWGDIDDMLALAMLHALQDRGEVKILAVTSSTDDKWCASYIDVVDTFYGHSWIPVGLVHNGVNGNAVSPPDKRKQTNYTQYISERRKPDGSFLYPHALTDGSKAPEAVALLRKTLAAEPDGSVVIIQVGFSTNLARLLESKSDSSSPLGGKDLIRRKVRLLSAMAGSFGDSEWEGRKFPKGSPEFNVKLDVPSAQRLFANWPSPIVVSGFEIGLSMLIKGQDIESKFAYANPHPIADTYRYTDPLYRLASTPPGMLHDHATFDLTSVLYAARPDDGYFSLSKPGTITVLPDGGTHFEESPKGKQRHLVMNDGQRIRALEAMTMLASQPPIKVIR